MSDQDRKQDLEHEDAGRRPPENDHLDRELDAVLAKYAAVEPRAGLEDRVLANLRSEREHATARVWWRWPALGVAAALLVIAALFLMGRVGMWRPGKPALEIAAHQPSAAGLGDKQPGTRSATNDVSGPVYPMMPLGAKRPARHGVRPPQAIFANSPRLDQFPSPRPLSDEEKLLVRYVHDFPQDAVMIAQAQAETEREMDQLNGNAPSGTIQDQQ